MRLLFQLKPAIFLMVSLLLPLISLSTTAADLDAAGPFTVEKQEYNFGDTAFQPPGLDHAVEVRASVHYPQELDQGPFPLVLLLHGRHITCFSDSEAFLLWPCHYDEDQQPVPSYRGFDYVSEILASYGYIAVSISANGISAYESDESGMQARAQLLQHHLNLWSEFNANRITDNPDTNTSDPFNGLFAGRVDMNAIGTLGHSRGGEGVARHVKLNQEQGTPHAISAMMLLAPTNFFREVINDAAIAVVLPYCDGDLLDLQGVHYYDDARYSSADNAFAKHLFLAMGSNHNFYNSVWTPDSSLLDLGALGSYDDWLHVDDRHCGLDSAERLNSEQQRSTATALITTFFRTYLGDETELGNILTGNAALPSPAAMSTIHASYHPPDIDRLDINRLDHESTLTNNSVGMPTAQLGLDTYDVCGNNTEERDCLPIKAVFQPHTAPSFYNFSKLGLTQLRLRWNRRGGWYENLLPPHYRDIRDYDVLQFRAGIDFTTLTEAEYDESPLDFQVQLRDGSGARENIRVRNITDAIFYPPGDSNGPLPKLFLNTVRIPLEQFRLVDLSNITSIRFVFDQGTQGAIMVADLALSREDFFVSKLPVPIKPNAPKAAYYGDSYTITWNGNDEASHYEVYQVSNEDLSDARLIYRDIDTSHTMSNSQGVYYYFVRACDEEICGEHTLIPNPVTVTDPLIINTDLILPEAKLNKHYEISITAQGGQPPYRWSLIRTLPDGLELSNKDNVGYISGMPIKRSKTTFLIMVEDSLGNKQTERFTLVVRSRRN